ncbi:hypothetical protein [Bradyrhizobium sp. McL0616]|uniref:hypothetical protein n=1 Tax=Bradyrhizobium sp. McL0616 TaxID=3415674 RepID=UPI003CF9049F
MSEIDKRVRAKLEMVLEETCRELENGGDHDTRKCIAEQLMTAIQVGHYTLGELDIVARRAVAEFKLSG